MNQQEIAELNYENISDVYNCSLSNNFPNNVLPVAENGSNNPPNLIENDSSI